MTDVAYMDSQLLSRKRNIKVYSNVGARAEPTLVFGLVVVAGLIGDAVLMSIGPHREVIASLTGASIAAVDDVLH